MNLLHQEERQPGGDAAFIERVSGREAHGRLS